MFNFQIMSTYFDIQHYSYFIIALLFFNVNILTFNNIILTFTDVFSFEKLPKNIISFF